MSIVKQFMQPENVYLIWELISEHNIVKNQSNAVKEDISNYIVNEIQQFYKNISLVKNSNLSLIELNKEYMKYIILHVKNNYSFPNEIQKIKIHSEESVPITFKDIQEQRELEFNTRFNEMQNDFTNMVTIKKPTMPQFEDKLADEPVSVDDMEQQIKEMTKRRNYDLQEIENENDTLTNKKSVSFENSNINTNEKQIENINITVNSDADADDNKKEDVYNFFSNLDSYDETATHNYQPESIDSNLQKQINEMKEQINSLENKLDIILRKLN
jgi:hypothetical protein